MAIGHSIGQSRLARLILPVTDRDHVHGPADAPATLVEYGDYECPFCGRAHPVVKGVQHRLGRRLRFAFRHFPLAEMHPHATRAAEAAEAAGAQGKFWAMHDMLFEHQHALTDPDLLGYAEFLGLDVQRFLTDLAEGAHEAKVRSDFMSGVRSGVNGTPTFFINGVRHDGPWDPDTLTEALLAAAAIHVHA
jgi:protein-disulfide isomerase